MKDLFGDDIPQLDEVDLYLREMDEATLATRKSNLEYILRIAPEGGFAMPTESYHVFTEARDAFVNGLYVSTIFLSQSFIEHRLQMYIHSLGLEGIGDKSLHRILKWLVDNRADYLYVWNRIDILRQFRNPFVHLKPFAYTHGLIQTSIKAQKSPEEILFDKSKEALSLMYTVATLPLDHH